MTRRLPIGLTVATVIALALLVGLGVWQLERLAWKRGVLAHIETAQTAPAAPLLEVLKAGAAGEDVNYRKVTIACPGLASAPYVELQALIDGQMGSRLISACRLNGAPYGSILVDRGFVQDIISARPPEDADDVRPVDVRGVLRAPEGRNAFAAADDVAHRHYFTRAVVPMAQKLGAPNPAPWFLMAETSSNPEWQALRPIPLPANVPNRHLEYALTWFGLAVVLLGVYAAMLRGRIKE